MQGRVFTDRNFDMLAKLEAFAVERGHGMGELAIAWLLAHPWLSTVIAGATNAEQVSANVAAAQWKLTAEEAVAVNQIA
jgi:aryl-alcohol dehydrogenase-like predicted oxidoreductase